MGPDGLTSREPIDRSLTGARHIWEAGKEKAAARLGEWKTRVLNVAAPVSVMVLGLPLLVLLACVAAQLPPGEEWE